MTHEFTKLKKDFSPEVMIFTTETDKNQLIVQIGKNLDHFNKSDIVKILREMNCLDGNRIRYDLLAPKIIHFVNELVKLTQKQ